VPEAIPGALREELYDSVIAAIGQGPDLSYVAEDDGLPMKRFKPLVDARGMASPGSTGAAAKGAGPKSAAIFAGGDLVNERKDAISAIADGHRAALGIDRLFSGKGA
jgi:NADPH-dependent glutamate synthase beta subunit-like oxidoreductase